WEAGRATNRRRRRWLRSRRPRSRSGGRSSRRRTSRRSKSSAGCWFGRGAARKCDRAMTYADDGAGGFPPRARNRYRYGRGDVITEGGGDDLGAWGKDRVHATKAASGALRVIAVRWGGPAGGWCVLGVSPAS